MADQATVNFVKGLRELQHVVEDYNAAHPAEEITVDNTGQYTPDGTLLVLFVDPEKTWTGNSDVDPVISAVNDLKSAVPADELTPDGIAAAAQVLDQA